MRLVTFNYVLQIQLMLTDCKPLPKPIPFICLIITPLEQLAANALRVNFLKEVKHSPCKPDIHTFK